MDFVKVSEFYLIFFPRFAGSDLMSTTTPSLIEPNFSGAALSVPDAFSSKHQWQICRIWTLDLLIQSP